MQAARFFSPSMQRLALRPVASFLVLLLAALAIRAVQFGNPIIQFDEQFYLLVGDRMWHGLLPYTDIWDRKPVGLFLIYAAIRMLGGEGIWQYQLVATAFAAATAFVIQRIALRTASPIAALAAGLLYLLFLMANGGDGGQAPVFYNLLTALAALALTHVIERPVFDRRAFMLACGIMALLGLALQVKYTVVFEGVYFGLVLVGLACRRGLPALRVLCAAVAWIAIALVPTAAATLGFWAFGHLSDFVFANFESIFLRPTSVDGDALPRLTKIAVHTAPLALAAVAGAWRAVKTGADRRVARFIGSWVIVAVAALLVFGTYHDHYALPLLLPFAVAAAPLWDIRRFGPAFVAVVIVFGTVLAIVTIGNDRAIRGGNPEARAITDYVRHRPPCTLFVFNGDPILYHLTGSTLPTRWSFPTLLSETRDIGTMQTDQLPELARIMAARPHFVVARNYPFPGASAPAWRYMQSQFAARYRVALVLPIRHGAKILYERLPDRATR
jgi:4-amino-4-deoxy-L-arabinose transferase-like glycosyltransferase